MTDGWGYANTNDSVHYRHRSGWPGWCGRSFGVATTNIWGRRSHWIVSTRKGGTLILTRQTIVSTRPGREVRSYERDGRIYLDGGSYQRGLDGCSYRQYRQGMDGRVYPSVKQCTHAHVDEEGKYAHIWKGRTFVLTRKGLRLLSTMKRRRLYQRGTHGRSFDNIDEEWIRRGMVCRRRYARSISFVRQGREVRCTLVSCMKKIYVSIETRIYYSCSALLIMSRKLK